MNKQIKNLTIVVFAAWALGMLGVWLSNAGYVVFGKILVYFFGPIGIICIFIGLYLFVKNRFFPAR